MKESRTVGTICLKDNAGTEYHISKIEYVEREDGSFYYVFTPDYSVIDLLPANLFQGIPGLDLSLRKEIYIRENIVPVFISERTPGPNREDLDALLKETDMEYLNRLEWLIRTQMHYGGDLLYVTKS